MMLHRQTEDAIQSTEQLEQLLLDRLPVEARASFLQIPAPEELGEDVHGLPEGRLQQAAEVIQQAGNDKQKILIFGDYDCDGVTSTAILWETLYELGIESRPFLPHREKHGYGISVAVLEEIWEEFQPDLLITVDNGIVANEAFSWLRERGVKTLLTDHHQPNGAIPEADVVLHSTHLSGAGVAWYLSHTLQPELAQKELDLAVLGTLADQVPLILANRSLAQYGLEALRNTQRQSLRALAKKAKIALDGADENTVHYTFAPRINAFGRMSHALEALRALLSRKPERMQQLLEQMELINQERQQKTNEAEQSLAEHILTAPEDMVIVAESPYPEGIIGLLASKLVDLYHKPAIVLSTLNGVPKASCRSVEGVNMIGLLRQLPSQFFLSLGGHQGAAGFSLNPEFKQEFLNEVKTVFLQGVTPDQLEEKIEVVGTLEWKLLTPALLRLLKSFSPYGNSNEVPLFSLGKGEVANVQPVGRDQLHHRVTFRNPRTKQTIQMISFHSQRRGIVFDTLHEPIVRLKASTFRPGTIDIELVAALE